MNTVFLGLQLLENESKNGSPLIRDTVREVKDSCEIALNILNDLLAFDKLEDGALNLEYKSISVWELIQESVRPFNIQVSEGIY